MKKTGKLISIWLVLIIIGLSLQAAGCSRAAKAKSETLVLTVDDTKVYLNEMMYHVMLAEMQGELYASVLQNGEDYWDMDDGNGATMAEVAKDMAMDNAVKYQLFYDLAMQKGYEMTDEEKEISKSQAENIMLNISAEVLQKLELSEEQLLIILDKIAIATRYYNDFVKTLDVDEEVIRDTFDPADYQQYDIEYIYATKKELAELEELKEEVKNATEFDQLSDKTSLKIGNLSFLSGKDTFGEETNLEEEIVSMNPGEVSDIIETVKGYYIIRLKDNTSKDSYETAVSDAVEQAKEEAFESAYEKLKKEHQITINNKIWKKVKMGENLK